MNAKFLILDSSPDKAELLECLALFRQEWELAADGISLIDTQASVGLILLDFTTRLGLASEEQSIVLGSRLYNEACDKPIDYVALTAQGVHNG